MISHPSVVTFVDCGDYFVVSRVGDNRFSVTKNGTSVFENESTKWLFSRFSNPLVRKLMEMDTAVQDSICDAVDFVCQSADETNTFNEQWWKNLDAGIDARIVRCSEMFLS